MKNIAKKKKIYIKTYGCQMNVYDSDKMLDLMIPHGFVEEKNFKDADLIILNTCHIREKAAEKVYSDLGRIVPIKKKAMKSGRKIKIVVAGCVAQAEGREIIKRQPAVDIVVGPQTYHKLPEFLFNSDKVSKSIVHTEFPVESKFDEIKINRILNNPVSFLSIQEGCNKFCSFCVVPYTRGAEYSRPGLDVLEEAKSLIKKGAKEICLLGQNVNAYHGQVGNKLWTLSRLIKEIAEIEGLRRIRYTTSHPSDMDEELIKAHGEVGALMPYLHLPVQSGDDDVLKSMNRKYTVESYKTIIEKLRTVCPDIALSSDFIVGFPGESDKAFDKTIKLVKEINFSQAYSFKYSRRPGTPGSIMKGQVSEKIKSKRLLALQKILNDQQLFFNMSFLNSKLEVLLERKGKYKNQLLGRSPYMQAIHVTDPSIALGQFIDVTIAEATKNSLRGNLIAINKRGMN